jgi:hypothetical protein
MIRYGGIKRYTSIKYLVVDEVDACLLNNGGKTVSKLILSSSSSSSSTPLHKLLSRYLSPTYDDGQGAMVDDIVSSSSSVLTVASTLTKSAPRPV